MVMAANLRPCHRVDANDLDRWQLSTAFSYRTRSDLVLSAGYRHEQKHYPVKTLESTFWQQLIAERPISGSIGSMGVRVEQASHRRGTRFSLRAGISRQLNDAVDVALASSLTWRSGLEKYPQATVLERNVTSIELRTKLSKKARLIASYEYKHYFHRVAKVDYEATVGIVWIGHGVELHRDIF